MKAKQELWEILEGEDEDYKKSGRRTLKDYPTDKDLEPAVPQVAR
jgi:hypothetical protein